MILCLYRTKLCTILDLGFEITNPNEIGQLMPKDRFEAENEGVDIVIDCTGVPAALEKAIQWTKMGATIMVFGYMNLFLTLQ